MKLTPLLIPLLFIITSCTFGTWDSRNSKKLSECSQIKVETASLPTKWIWTVKVEEVFYSRAKDSCMVYFSEWIYNTIYDIAKSQIIYQATITLNEPGSLKLWEQKLKEFK